MHHTWCMTQVTDGLETCPALPCMADPLGRTALHWASEMGRLEAAKLLLSLGIDAKAADCNGRCVNLAGSAYDGPH